MKYDLCSSNLIQADMKCNTCGMNIIRTGVHIAAWETQPVAPEDLLARLLLHNPYNKYDNVVNISDIKKKKEGSYFTNYYFTLYTCHCMENLEDSEPLSERIKNLVYI